jgi:outer membrane immunogenic protein
MKTFLLGAVASLALVAAGNAAAADMPLKAPAKMVPPALSWNVCYFGGHAGGDWAKSSWTYRNINPYDATSAAGPILRTNNDFDDVSSWLAGAQLGCNFQFSGLVLGVEIAGSATNLDKTTLNAAQPFRGFTETVETKIPTLFTATGRVGYAFTPAFLAYVKGGVASVRVDTFGTLSPFAPGFNFTTSVWHNGVVVGGGGEYMVMPNVTFGVEYDYIKLDTIDHTGNQPANPLFPVIHGVNASIQSVTARVNFLFGRH